MFGLRGRKLALSAVPSCDSGEYSTVYLGFIKVLYWFYGCSQPSTSIVPVVHWDVSPHEVGSTLYCMIFPKLCCILSPASCILFQLDIIQFFPSPPLPSFHHHSHPHGTLLWWSRLVQSCKLVAEGVVVEDEVGKETHPLLWYSLSLGSSLLHWDKQCYVSYWCISVLPKEQT